MMNGQSVVITRAISRHGTQPVDHGNKQKKTGPGGGLVGTFIMHGRKEKVESLTFSRAANRKNCPQSELHATRPQAPNKTQRNATHSRG